MSKQVGSHTQRVWLMGFANSTYGFGYAVVLVTAPQLLASHGVAEPVIAGMTTLALSSSLLVFAVAPVLDTLISRRAWSIGLGLAGAALTTLVMLLPATSHILGAALAADALVLSLYNSAVGGWLGAVLPKSSDETIGTWFTIGNSSGFGLGALTQYWLLTHTRAGLGAALVGVATLIPLAVLPLVPATDAGRKAVHESFRNLARDVVQLVRQPLVLRVLLMFILPCAAFTLTNAFGGMGPDFHATDNLVSVVNGIGAVVIGVFASILARLVLERISAPLLYLAIGSLGAAFTLGLLALPHSPATYLLAVLGENAAQSFAQVSQNAIIFRSIRQGSPLASSQFGLLSTAFVVPYVYMQGLDGFGYKLAGGVTGSFTMDALVSLAACALLFWPVLRWVATGKLEVPGEDSTTEENTALHAVTWPS
ncbi:MAG TPA: MFS transporter [Steroidobacteraceae bacterium]|nr:MFS transporter [Steroidobacteraceae bacterium]